MKLKSVLRAIKNKEFLIKTELFVQKKFSRLVIKNKNILSQNENALVFNFLQKKYSFLVEQSNYDTSQLTQNNTVWVCWLQGIENAPPLVQACVNSVCNNLDGKELVILTEKNLFDYISLPDYIFQKYLEGKISRTHFSDIIRTVLLAEKGGTWIDATVLCTDSPFLSFAASQPLFVFKCLDLVRNDSNPIINSSWLISCCSRHPIMLLTRDLLFEYWKTNDDLINYFLFHLFFTMSCNHYNDLWKAVPTFNNHSPHVLQFELDKEFNRDRWNQITSQSSIHKLNRYIDGENKQKTNYNHIINLFGDKNV